jgi:hypothetical protein
MELLAERVTAGLLAVLPIALAIYGFYREDFDRFANAAGGLIFGIGISMLPMLIKICVDLAKFAMGV